MAAHLAAQDWPPRSRIGILGKNSAAWIMADLAIWMAGHVSVPLYPLQSADNVRQIAGHSGMVACFIGKLDAVDLLDGLTPGIVRLALPLAPAPVEAVAPRWDDIVAATLPIAGSPLRAGGDLATIVYTSGTTGQAKGVMHSFDSLTSGWLTVRRQLDFTQADRALSYLPLAHIMEHSGLELGSLDGGCHLYFAESLDSFVKDLQRARPTVFISVPRLLLKFQQGVLAKMPAPRLDRLLAIPVLGHFVRRKIQKGLGLDAARVCGSGSAPLSVDLLRWYDRLGIRLIEGYGMTELASASHMTETGPDWWGTVGRPGDGVDHRIDPQTGEVQVLSAGATLGYYLAPELTAELFTEDGWLRTGDKGEIDADGRLRLIGRIKDNFKSSKGKYVAPAPIEHKLIQNPSLDACLVIGAGLSQPVGVVVLNEAAITRLPAARATIEADLANHLQAVNATLDPHERLDYLVISTRAWTPENGMLTPTLKARRASIEKHFAARIATGGRRDAPVVWDE
jgi:long-chain acyl-CoA synthetase